MTNNNSHLFGFAAAVAVIFVLFALHRQHANERFKKRKGKYPSSPFKRPKPKRGVRNKKRPSRGPLL